MNGAPLAVFPKRGSSLGVGSLLQNAAALIASLSKASNQANPDLPRGDGSVVLVILAFLAGDWATARLRNFLRSLGYRVETANVGINIGPTKRLVAKLETTLLRLSAEHDGPIAIVGQSLGGVLARDLAQRYPEHVRHVVTLCSPIRVPITTPLAPAARLLSPLYDSGWLGRRVVIIGPLRVDVSALYSEEDGVVDWRECLQDDHPGCENIRVSGAHATIGSSPAALACIAKALVRKA
jgi:pimeloyl-ACP methyl ester carboxylesterase